jgi:heme-degrading monooxygenase HmoA
VSVLVTARIPGDVAKFRQLLADDPGRFEAITARGRESGAIHHRFGIGDGFVVVYDEWESAEQFQQFFQSPEIAEVMVDGGAQGEPEVTITEAIAAPGDF